MGRRQLSTLKAIYKPCSEEGRWLLLSHTVIPAGNRFFILHIGEETYEEASVEDVLEEARRRLKAMWERWKRELDWLRDREEQAALTERLTKNLAALTCGTIIIELDGKELLRERWIHV